MRGASFHPETGPETLQAIKEIIELHGGSHVVKLIKRIKPDASLQDVYKEVRDEALVNCSRLLGLRENQPMFNPASGKPLETPEARLALMEELISEKTGGDGSSLELLGLLLSKTASRKAKPEFTNKGLQALREIKRLKMELDDETERLRLARIRDFSPDEGKVSERNAKPEPPIKSGPVAEKAEGVSLCNQCGDEVGGAPYCSTCGHKTPEASLKKDQK